LLTNPTVALPVGFVNYGRAVPVSREDLIKPSDLIDVREVAKIIGMNNPGGVSVYRRRYSDFPAPVVNRGRCVLWLRRDVEAWARTTGRLP
jgi:predicted DNA-binding transcriptional regulator AlpA